MIHDVYMPYGSYRLQKRLVLGKIGPATRVFSLETSVFGLETSVFSLETSVFGLETTFSV